MQPIESTYPLDLQSKLNLSCDALHPHYIQPWSVPSHPRLRHCTQPGTNDQSRLHHTKQNCLAMQSLRNRFTSTPTSKELDGVIGWRIWLLCVCTTVSSIRPHRCPYIQCHLTREASTGAESSTSPRRVVLQTGNDQMYISASTYLLCWFASSARSMANRPLASLTVPADSDLR